MQPRSPLLRLLFRVCVCLGLALLVGLCGMLAGVSLHAHAAPAATLTVTDCSGQTGPGRIGTVISSNSTFANNFAGDGGGGINNFFNSTMSISNSTVFNNRARLGAGGIFNDDATLSVSNSTIANNLAESGAGGIWNINSTGT